MKYLIVVVFAFTTAFARPQTPQQQPQTQQSQQGAQQRPQAYSGQPQQQAYSGSGVTPVSIVSQTEEVGPDGSFNYSFDTSDGVHVEQGGYVKPGGQARSADPNNPDDASGDIQVIQGAYSYTAPDGQQISLRYVADENGFQPEGEHLPTAPPVPEGIARSLEQQPQQGQQQGQQQGSFQHQGQQQGSFQQHSQTQSLQQQRGQAQPVQQQQQQPQVAANPSPVAQN